jgi:hypothetical protein
MPKITYETKRFSKETQRIIGQAEVIISGYQRQGFKLTLRQLYYQFVSRSLIPNTEQSYKKIGNIISDARRAGLIDWEAIEDRTRYLRQLSNWDKPQDIISSARDSYHRDLWANQDKRIEVWIEKDALVGVIEGICQKNDVPFFSCRGYVSDSEMWGGGIRIFHHHNERQQKVIILHLGDHDPSGIDMTRDIEDRLRLFSGWPSSDNPEIRRIALTMEQIDELNPPPNPAKITDSRYNGYVSKYGEESWELDALEPQYISNLIETQILAERNDELWNQLVDEQEKERKQIDKVIKQWDKITKE